MKNTDQSHGAELIIEQSRPVVKHVVNIKQDQVSSDGSSGFTCCGGDRRGRLVQVDEKKNQVDPNIPTFAILNQRAVSVPLWV